MADPHPLNAVSRAALLIVGTLACSCASSPKTEPGPASVPIPLAESPTASAEPLATTEPPAPPLATLAPVSAEAMARRDRALSAVGVRYRYGGNTPETGFDCSGLVRWIFHDRAAELPRSSLSLSRVPAEDVGRAQLQIADLVFFRINRARTITHVGMYVGDGEFVHAPSSGGRVRLESLDSPYWAARLVKARRLPAANGWPASSLP